MEKRRVVITGLGVVSPLGNKVSDMWQALLAGKSGVKPITRFDASSFPTQIAAEVRDFDPALVLDLKSIRKTDVFVQFAMESAVRRGRIQD